MNISEMHRHRQAVNGIINSDSFPIEPKNLMNFDPLTKKL